MTPAWMCSRLDIYHSSPLPRHHDDSSSEIRAWSDMKRHVQCAEAAEQLLSENQSLVALIKQCLRNKAAQRPHTSDKAARNADSW